MVRVQLFLPRRGKPPRNPRARGAHPREIYPLGLGRRPHLGRIFARRCDSGPPPPTKMAQWEARVKILLYAGRIGHPLVSTLVKHTSRDPSPKKIKNRCGPGAFPCESRYARYHMIYITLVSNELVHRL